MKGALPPNSRHILLTDEAPHAKSCFPTTVDPVKLRTAISGDSQRVCPIEGARVRSDGMI